MQHPPLTMGVVDAGERHVMEGVAQALEHRLVKPDIGSTVDAACLSKMAQRGQIRHAIVDGPLSNAIKTVTVTATSPPNSASATLPCGVSWKNKTYQFVHPSTDINLCR
jgi:hypothetical protein